MANLGDSLRKKEAFKSFLQTSSTPTVDSKKNASDNEAVFEEQYVEQTTNCNVCGNDVPDAVSKKKSCGFCEQVACQEHLRKRRRKKNKWQKICDNCQDKFLYDTYMKLQIKAEQSLSVEEEIVGMKYEDAKQILENKKVKRRQLSFCTQEMQSKFDDKMLVITKQDNRFQSLNNKLESDEITCGQVEEYIHRMENKIKSNYEQDFRILSEEDDKLGAQLSRVEKKCMQVRSAIQKREKQLEQAYQQWERRQFGKVEQAAQKTEKQRQQQQGCQIF